MSGAEGKESVSPSAVCIGDSRKIPLRCNGCKRPGAAAIRGECKVGALSFGLLVVAAGDDALLRVTEGDGEDTG